MSRHVRIARYGINGVVATVAHYGVLALNLNGLKFTSAGATNRCTAVFGINASFFGVAILSPLELAKPSSRKL